MRRTIEIVRPPLGATRQCKAALFDFDGTLSLLRSGWRDVMIEMMLQELGAVRGAPAPAQLSAIVADNIDHLTGHQTIFQMIRLAELIREYGGRPLPPLQYKYRYLETLELTVARRRVELRHGASADRYRVPGAVRLLKLLRSADVRCYLASGTDIQYVQAEAELLDVARYFDVIYGAVDEYWRFSKGKALDDVIQKAGGNGTEVVVIGDGRVEMAEGRARGCLAIGVASEEIACRNVDEWKRERLVLAGADVIVPHLRPLALLLGRGLSS